MKIFKENRKSEIALEQADNQVEGLKERTTAAKVEAARKEQEHNQVKQLRMEKGKSQNILLCQKKRLKTILLSKM